MKKTAKINPKALELTGTSVKDFVNWCNQEHKATYKISSKQEFFWKIMTKRLVRDNEGNLVKKRSRTNV